MLSVSTKLAGSLSWRGEMVASSYVAVYVLLDWISYVQPVLKLGITPWNPQAGLTLAFLIFYGPSRAIATAIAALLAEVLVRGTPAPWPILVLTSLLIAASYGLAARVLRARGVTGPIDSLERLVWFIATSACVALVVSVTYVSVFAASNILPMADIDNSIAKYWVGDLNGVLTLAPLILAAHRWRIGWREVARRHWEVFLQIGVTLGALWLIFGMRWSDEMRFFYPLFVPVVWIAFRWGVAGTAASTLLIQIALIVAVRGEEGVAPLIDMQFLMITLGMTGLLLGAVITERLASEVRLRERDIALARAMRFASLGEFATALTHELNQPITALVSYLQSARILAAPLQNQDARLTETLDKGASEAMRTAQILRRLRNFYRGGAPRLTAIDIEPLATAVLDRYEERLRRTGVALRSMFDSGLPHLLSDRTQIEMTLHNLISNAADAVSDSANKNPEIVLSVTRDGEAVLLSVDDSGPGVAAEVAEHLFDPFTTTKSDGMGLGLAICRTLLRSLGGDLRVEASVLGGARFVMRVPIEAKSQSQI